MEQHAMAVEPRADWVDGSRVDPDPRRWQPAPRTLIRRPDVASRVLEQRRETVAQPAVCRIVVVALVPELLDCQFGEVNGPES